MSPFLICATLTKFQRVNAVKQRYSKANEGCKVTIFVVLRNGQIAENQLFVSGKSAN